VARGFHPVPRRAHARWRHAGPHPRHRPQVCFVTALQQLDLSAGDLLPALFGYNLGVELGQITIVLVTAPLILHLQRHRRYHPIVRGLAAVIFIAGVAWFVQRL